ncbi:MULTISPECIES: hypothetical protein [Mycobacterium]|nr:MULTISPECIES: hypothetical protein [Mycobacterium]
MMYRVVDTAVGWLLYAGGDQLGTYDTPGEVFSAAARDETPVEPR